MEPPEISPRWLTGLLRADAGARAALGECGCVASLAAERLLGAEGKTGARLLRVVPRYARLPAGAGRAPPASLLVKLSSRPLTGRLAAWMAEQDAREVEFYREHGGRLRTPAVFHAAATTAASRASSCVVMEDLTGSHQSGEEAAAQLFYGCGPAAMEDMAAIAVREMARLHSGSWGCAQGEAAHATYLMSTVFRHGHDAQKSALAGSAGRLTDRLVRRRGRTGSMLAVRWPTPRPPAADRAAFALALAQAAPSLGLGVDSDLVVSMLRAVERHRGASATALPAAAATWHRMSSRNAALCHGDYHPGNLLYRMSPASPGGGGASPTAADDGLRVIDFQHWGWAPVAFELLYFVAHAVPMWGLQLDSVPWLLQLYIDSVPWQLRRADSPQLSVEMLLEEMLFVSVEFCASFLADETFDGRQSEPSTPRQSLRVAGSGTSAAPTSGAGATTLPTVKAKWEFSSSLANLGSALARASQLDVVLRLGAHLLASRWGACGTPLGRAYSAA